MIFSRSLAKKRPKKWMVANRNGSKRVFFFPLTGKTMDIFPLAARKLWEEGTEDREEAEL